MVSTQRPSTLRGDPVQSIPTSDLPPLRSLESVEAVELSVYFDPLRNEARSPFYDALESEYVDHHLRISHRFDVAGSFGRSGRVRTDTTVDVGPPLVLVAVDAGSDIRSTLGSVSSLVGDMLVTIAPAEIVFGTAEVLQRLGSEPAELVVHCRRGRGRDDRHGVGGVVEELRRHGIAGATALGRGEGTIAGHRYRPRLLSPPPDGPMMVVSIDCADVFARAAPALLTLPQAELITAKPISLCKWRGRRQPPPAPSADRPAWSRITLYAAGDAALAWRPEHLKLLQRLRKLGAPGATVLRGTTGYALSDPHQPDQSPSGHRTAPMVTTIVDTPDHAAQWLRAIDDATKDDGLVTHEFVSAQRVM
jgi:PII-like signaling protein